MLNADLRWPLHITLNSSRSGVWGAAGKRSEGAQCEPARAVEWSAASSVSGSWSAAPPGAANRGQTRESGRWTIMDGIHRLLKAVMLELDQVHVRRVPARELSRIRSAA